MKKKVILFLAIVLIAAMVVGCAPSAEEPAEEAAPEEEAAVDDELTVGFVSANFNDTGQVYIKDGAKAKAEELGMLFLEADAQEDVIKKHAS